MNASLDEHGSVRPILVGVDGSDSALSAAHWAAREAAVRQAPIRLVYAFGWMPVHDADDPVQIVPEARDAIRRTAEERLAVAAERVAEVAPDVAVSREVITGMPAALLVTLSKDAQLAVVGHRGLGGFAGLLLGSVGTALAAHAACPVVIVRGATETRPDGPVVVGVDGSPQSGAALAFAVEAAVAHRVPLRAVHAWRDSAMPYVVSGPMDWDELEKRERDVLSEQLDAWRGKYPDLRVEPVLAEGRPAQALRPRAGCRRTRAGAPGQVGDGPSAAVRSAGGPKSLSTSVSPGRR
jgi:nucleotide-binding universal stress UspA family protein